MRTLYLHHSAFLDHQTPAGHPERPDRMRAVEQAMEAEEFQHLIREQSPMAEVAQIERAHPDAYVEAIREAVPSEGLVGIDGDTVLSKGSWEAGMRASGAACHAIDEVMAGKVDNAFCAHRPPGHHAEVATAMGFCFFNHVAVAARHAQAVHGLERVAIVDFDVHHGNGTQDIFWSDPNVLYASTHQMPLFPGTGAARERGVGNIFNAPLSPGDGSDAFREAMETVILPSIDNFRPDIILISAGFDAHHRDPLASLQLVEQDYGWITRKLMEKADGYAKGRLVSMLEGGYDLTGLSKSVTHHVRALMGE
ncbi:Histone deacetylase-like amidohydrolase [Hartmannibacter diazotrophicus]|uniref:Histone deacetylase-like amidohydrolase n=1 Tax=Hartmannibacter diazotrophicus TaxID=1482074 RepID=A0A2C9D3F0_9HYPH|nr:histone deacetylase family protein [Hartmannibacter diazotrophicus]SON54753.1 Histone deacetylase-like amidohydrolase [Hartmannibacter diazotrophicus]